MNLKKKFKEVVTIIAPRHIERTNEIMHLSHKLNLNGFEQNVHIIIVIYIIYRYNIVFCLIKSYGNYSVNP